MTTGCRTWYVELLGDCACTSWKAATGDDAAESMAVPPQDSSPNPWTGGSWLSEPAVSVVVSSKKLRLNSSVVPAPNDTTSAVNLSADGAPPRPAANVWSILNTSISRACVCFFRVHERACERVIASARVDCVGPAVKRHERVRLRWSEGTKTASDDDRRLSDGTATGRHDGNSAAAGDDTSPPPAPRLCQRRFSDKTHYVQEEDETQESKRKKVGKIKRISCFFFVLEF